jgi:hypothetical protein
MLAGAGTQTAGLAFWWLWSSSDYNATEEYDGFNLDSWWSFSQQQEEDLAGAGTQTAALAFGGFARS